MENRGIQHCLSEANDDPCCKQIEFKLYKKKYKSMKKYAQEYGIFYPRINYLFYSVKHSWPSLRLQTYCWLVFVSGPILTQYKQF